MKHRETGTFQYGIVLGTRSELAASLEDSAMKMIKIALEKDQKIPTINRSIIGIVSKRYIKPH